MLKRNLLLFILSGVVLLAPGWTKPLQAQEKPVITAGDFFPKITLKAPVNPRDKAYLGIPKKNIFAVKDIPAEVILVEIMNVYCASCQNMAPVYNKLFARIEARPALRKKIKMVAFAVGNDEGEIKIYRDHFQVPFPIIPDTNYDLHKAIGGGPTPFSILVRRGGKGKSVVVASTHLGFNEKVEELFSELELLLKTNPEDIKKKGEKTEARILTAKPPMTEEEIQAKIKEAFTEEGKALTGFEKVDLRGGRAIYAGTIKKEGQTGNLFAAVISQLPTCDLCHDTHFIVTFEPSGKIQQFIPLQLTKTDNENWNEADIARMRKKIVGRFIYHPFSFKAKVDAVTSATITSAAIFRGLNEGQEIFKELKKKGLL